MHIRTDIETEADIEHLVHSFYARVRVDEVLSPVFYRVITGDWNQHLQGMCDFWSTLLLYSRKYLSDPMVKHTPLPITQAHFERWLQLWETTIDQLFAGPTAEEAAKRARNIARVMHAMKKITSV